MFLEGIEIKIITWCIWWSENWTMVYWNILEGVTLWKKIILSSKTGVTIWKCQDVKSFSLHIVFFFNNSKVHLSLRQK